MLRTLFSSLALLAIFAGAVAAKDKKTDKAKGDNAIHAMFVKADVAKNTLTFKTTDKAGKTMETTLPLAKDARILGKDNKPETLAALAKSIQSEKDKWILVTEDKDGKQIIEVKDHPSKS